MDKLDKTVFVIGSLKQQEDIERISAGYKKTYKNVLFVSADPSKSIAEHIKECFDRIESADMIVAVKKPNNTFGEGVTYADLTAMFAGESSAGESNGALWDPGTNQKAGINYANMKR